MTGIVDDITARNEMFVMLETAWLAGTSAIVGYVAEIRWAYLEQGPKPDRSKYWARGSTKIVYQGEAGVGFDDVSEQRRYDTAGNLFVQVFGPMQNDPQVGDRLSLLSALARDAFRGKTSPSGVWFRNCRVQELAPDNEFQRYNVVVEFQYQTRA